MTVGEVAGAIDVLIVSLGSTGGLRAADAELADSLQRAGVSVAVASATPPRPVRTLALTDLSWALAARRVARRELARCTPRAIIYSSTTAALLWPAPGAIRFDAPAAGNRPGRHGLWQRPLERRRLRRAPLLLPLSEGALREVPAGARRIGRELVLPVPIEASGVGPASAGHRRDHLRGQPSKEGARSSARGVDCEGGGPLRSSSSPVRASRTCDGPE